MKAIAKEKDEISQIADFDAVNEIEKFKEVEETFMKRTPPAARRAMLYTEHTGRITNHGVWEPPARTRYRWQDGVLTPY